MLEKSHILKMALVQAQNSPLVWDIGKTARAKERSSLSGGRLCQSDSILFRAIVLVSNMIDFVSCIQD
jgi:hypothetical protein